MLLEPRMMEMVMTTGAVRCKKLQSNHHLQQTNTNFLQAGCSSCRPTNSVWALHIHRTEKSTLRNDRYMLCVARQFTEHCKTVSQWTSAIYDIGAVRSQHLSVVWTQRHQTELPRRLGHSVWYVCLDACSLWSAKKILLPCIFTEST